jgi:uncharacterized protein YceH (UPF0502 family)
MNMLDRSLSPPELRVLGALIEKEITTPEYYPLSLNALINACNQKSSREPVLDLSQRDVLAALDGLEAFGFTASVHDGRVVKYEHRIRTVLHLRRDETALLCLLLLRGPQTPGELRSRADRLYAFDDLTAVIATLDRLASRALHGVTTAEVASQPNTGPITIMLSRQPGARESRYAQLLGGAISRSVPEYRAEAGSSSNKPLEDTVFALIQTVRTLEARIAELESTAHQTHRTSVAPAE